MIRLDKFLADMKVGTRQEVKKYVRQGRVLVDGEICKKADLKIDETKQTIIFDGEVLSYVKFEYIMLNKPAGVLSATEDRKQETVLDLISDAKRKDLFPVGRLDKDTEGLLLLTNDGQLAHRLLSPKKHVDKLYFARIDGEVTNEDVQLFSKGVNIGTDDVEEMTRPAKLEILNASAESEILLTIQEGKFHQVKRMFQAVGKEVVYLKRMSMGTLKLDESLHPGDYRYLTEEEIKAL